MKRTVFLSLFLFGLSATLFAQSQAIWDLPVHNVKFMNESGRAANLKVDPGFDYADLIDGSEKIRFFYNRNNANFRQARIFDQETNELIARGKGGFFFGDAKMVFTDGSVVKLKKLKNANGYDIIGPHGSLFTVENHGIKPLSTLNKPEFLTQTFFVFERIRATQQPPADIIYLYGSNTFSR